MKLSKNQLEALSRFKSFVSFRNKISLILSLVILVCFYAFILSVGLVPEVLGYRLGPSSVTLGILAGIFLIILSIIATGLYTFLANSYFDKDQDEILRELDENNVTESLKNGELSYREFSQQGGGQ